eukprot:2037998-Lingulodinium_polyedra.AAC.1
MSVRVQDASDPQPVLRWHHRLVLLRGRARNLLESRMAQRHRPTATAARGNTLAPDIAASCRALEGRLATGNRASNAE